MGIAIGSFFALVFRVMALFFWGVIGIITARTLSVEDRGVYASAVIVTGLLTAILSFNSASSYLVANKHRDEAEVAVHGTVLSLLFAGVLLIGALVTSLFVPDDLRLVVILCGLVILPSIVRSTLNGVLLGANKLHRYNISGNMSAGMGLVAILLWVGILGHRSIESALGAWMVAQFASLVPVLYWGRRWWAWPLNHRLNRPVLTGLVTFGAVTSASTVINFFNYRIDVLMVVGLDSREGAGIYSSSVALAEALWLFSSAIAVASYARVGSMAREEAARLTAVGVRHTLLVVVSGAIVAAALAPVLLGTLFGGTYRAGAEPLRILCIGTAANAPAGLLSNYFVIQLGRPSIALWLALFSCTVSVLVGFLLIPSLGTSGAAWATTISYTSAAAIAVVIFKRNSTIPMSDLWRIRREDVLSYVYLVKRLLRIGPASATEPARP